MADGQTGVSGLLVTNPAIQACTGGGDFVPTPLRCMVDLIVLETRPRQFLVIPTYAQVLFGFLLLFLVLISVVVAVITVNLGKKLFVCIKSAYSLFVIGFRTFCRVIERLRVLESG